MLFHIPNLYLIFFVLLFERAYSQKEKTDINYTPIKIKNEFKFLVKPNNIKDESYEKLKYFIEETTSEIQKFLKVQHTILNKNLKEEINNITEVCSINELNSNVLDYFEEYDLIIFYEFKTLPFDVIASAKPCYFDNNIRPIFGRVNLRNTNDYKDEGKEKYFKFILLHEITHILVFHNYFFDKLGMGFYKLIDDKNIFFINSSKVLKTARKHFNCESLTGLPLEDHGGEGTMNSHWEARYMIGDYMVGEAYYDSSISDITLALFEDTGFYQVEYYSGGLFKFGKNKGCSFFNTSCINKGKTSFPEEFCDEINENKCTQSRTNKGYCTKISFFNFYETTGKCPIVVDGILLEKDYRKSCYIGKSELHKDFGETIGENSFCFESSLLPSEYNNFKVMQIICYEVECDRKKMEIIVKIGGLSFNCPTNGGIRNNPPGFKGEIKCPKYYDICDSTVLCNDLFECLNKKSKTDEKSYDYNNEEYYYPESTNDQIFTVKKLKTNLLLSCFELIGSFNFDIEGEFSKDINILDKVNINLSTSSGKTIKSKCTPFSETSFQNARLQCDIDICIFPLENIDIYLPIKAPTVKGYKFNYWKAIIGAEPGVSNVIKNVNCLPKITNIFIPSEIKIKRCLKKKIFFEIYGKWEDINEKNIPHILVFSLVIGNNIDNVAECEYIFTNPIHMNCELLDNGDNQIIIEEQYFNGIFATFKMEKYNEIIMADECNNEDDEFDIFYSKGNNIAFPKNLLVLMFIINFL